MKNRKKSGFTIVELIIVIAVIGVLAAILIPAFQGMIKKAHMADDKAMAKNFNTALVAAQISEEIFPKSMAEVVAVLESAGYRGEQLKAKATGCSFIWDSQTNQIMYGEINTTVKTKGAPAQSPITIYYSMNPEYSKTTSDWYVAISNPTDITGSVDCTYFLLDSANVESNLEISSPCGIGVMMGKKLIVNEGVKIIFNTEKAGTIKLDGIIYGDVEINAPQCNVVQSGAVKKLTIAEIKNDDKSEIKGYAKELVVISGKVIIQHNAYIQSFGNNSSSISDNNGYIDTYNADDASNIRNLGFVHQTSFNMPDGFNPVLEKVYHINNVRDLLLFREMTNGGCSYKGTTVKLNNDISLNNIANWIPIGGGAFYEGQGDSMVERKSYFGGTFDGNGKTISGLHFSNLSPEHGFNSHTQFDRPNSPRANVGRYMFGFFGGVIGGTIKDLNVVVNADIKALTPKAIGTDGKSSQQTILGTVVGYLHSSETSVATISNVTVSGNIKTIGRVGGIVGGVADGVIKNCTNRANIEVNFSEAYSVNNYGEAGGIACWVRHYTPVDSTIPFTAGVTEGATTNVYKVLFENCKNEGNIKNNIADAVGILGRALAADTQLLEFRNCVNTGTLETTVSKHYTATMLGRSSHHPSTDVFITFTGCENIYVMLP